MKHFVFGAADNGTLQLKDLFLASTFPGKSLVTPQSAAAMCHVKSKATCTFSG